MIKVPAYPRGEVVGPCVCGSWPGGKCLKCRLIVPSAGELFPKPDAELDTRPALVRGAVL